MPTPQPLSSSIEIAAPPAAVWAVVSDFARMPEFSPELRRLWVVGRAREAGARLLGVNRRGLVVWPTTSTVVRYEAQREVAWRTRESGATWSYLLEPTATGTRLTNRRDLASFTIGTTLLAPVIGGAAGHDRELAEGMRATLERIRETLESRVVA